MLRASGHDSLRVIFAGGTTGGHLMPGAATAEALRLLLPSSRPLFLVADRTAERRCRGAIADFETVQIPVTAWEGLAQKIRFPIQALCASERVRSVVRGFRPHVVVGLGGHNSVAPILVGRLLGMKTVLFESNAKPGRAVRLLAPLADCVVVQWRRTAARLKARRVVAAGNPVRARLFGVQRQGAARRLGLSPHECTLLALGGSQGALALNEALYGALKLLYRKGMALQVIHLTGVDHLPAALEQQANQFTSYRPIGFLERMEDAYAAADFVLARAGGSTLAELTALGLPSILVPYPYAAADHQRANAAVLAKARASVTIPQSELSVERLADTIEILALNAHLRSQMAEGARQLGRPQAALTVAAELATMAGFSAHIRLSPRTDEQITDRFSRAA